MLYITVPYFFFFLELCFILFFEIYLLSIQHSAGDALRHTQRCVPPAILSPSSWQTKDGAASQWLTAATYARASFSESRHGVGRFQDVGREVLTVSGPPLSDRCLMLAVFR